MAKEPSRVYSDGPDAAALAAECGMELDGWQKDVLEVWLGRDAFDRFTATSCGLSVPRQNGKNVIVEVRELYGLAVMGEQILHTAHEVKTANKSFKRLRAYFEDERRFPELAAMVKVIRRTNGQESIELTNGGLIEYSARSHGAARGFTTDLVVFDEAEMLTDDQMDAVVPTMAASPRERQLIYVGTPPGPKAPGEVFSRTREDDDDEHLSWHEWSVAEVGDIHDRSRWYATNPGLGIRLTEEWSETELHRLSEEGFARERLGYWTLAAGRAVIKPEMWEKLLETDPPVDGRIAYGVKFKPDGSLMALAACIKPKEGPPHVELVKYKPMSEGITWLADWLIARKDTTCTVVVDGQNGVAELVAQLRAGHVSAKAITVCGTREVIAASSRFYNAVCEGKVTHYGQEQLTNAALKACKRTLGHEGGFGFDSIGDDDVTPLEACAQAYWGAMTSKRHPGRKVQLY